MINDFKSLPGCSGGAVVERSNSEESLFFVGLHHGRLNGQHSFKSSIGSPIPASLDVDIRRLSIDELELDFESKQEIYKGDLKTFFKKSKSIIKCDLGTLESKNSNVTNLTNHPIRLDSEKGFVVNGLEFYNLQIQTQFKGMKSDTLATIRLSKSLHEKMVKLDKDLEEDSKKLAPDSEEILKEAIAKVTQEIKN